MLGEDGFNEFLDRMRGGAQGEESLAMAVADQRLRPDRRAEGNEAQSSEPA
jgi:hypothetical protein